MRRRRLGSSTLDVSVVGLGTNNFGGRIDEAASRAVIDAALDSGIDFLDTADVYGNRGGSEEIIGRALAGRRDRVVLATKFGHDLGDGETARGARPYIRKAIEASLRRLQTDWIDLYQYHRPDGVTPVEETLAALDELVQEGKVRAIGSSNFTPAMVEEAHAVAAERGLTPFVSEQSEYSWLAREAERELLPVSRAARDRLHPLLPARERSPHRQVPARGAAAGGDAPARARARRGSARPRRATGGARERSRRLAARARDRRARGPARDRLGDRGRDEARAGARERSSWGVGAVGRAAGRPASVVSEEKTARCGMLP